MVKRRYIAGVILSLALAAPLAAQPPTTAVIGTPPQPGWSLLSAQQKTILAPLAGEWDRMENIRRKKWLGIAERYPAMKPDEQRRVQERMREWARRESPERLDRMAENPLVFSEALPASMHGVIDAIVQRHGSLRDYVLHLGVPAESLARLEAELLEPL